jgi:DNA-binding transcriptional regulator PaaX
MRVVRDGLFHHPEGATAQAILKRMAEGTTSYHFDDPFKPAIDATDDEIARIEKRIFDAEWRIVALKEELKRAQQKRADQEAALIKFAETGEIDPVIMPPVDALARSEVAKADAEIRGKLDFKLPDALTEQGWVQKGKPRVTEHEILITISKSRTDDTEYVEKVEERLAKAVSVALQPFAVDGSRFRKALRERIAARPQQPREPPDD